LVCEADAFQGEAIALEQRAEAVGSAELARSR
jgi:hypothetical protein